MSIAPNQKALKKRLDRYFWDNKTTEMDKLTSILKNNFRDLGRVAVIGGLVRDFAREGRSGFHSDVDLVIDAPKDKVAQLALSLKAVPNRFGGYGYKDGPWKIDFWALETTWGKKHVAVNKLEDVIGSTFFDWDAIAYELWEGKLICEDDYLDKIKSRKMDINLLPNPSPMGNLVRAVRRLVLWHVDPGPELRDFIDEYLDDIALRYIKEKESELYSFKVSMQWKSADEAKKIIFTCAKKNHNIKQIDMFD